jgi:hypothetical protein
MTRPDRKANKAVLDRLKHHLVEGKNGGEPKDGEIPVSASTRVALESVKALYAQQTATYQQNLQIIGAEAAEDQKIDRATYILDIDQYVWRKKAP